MSADRSVRSFGAQALHTGLKFSSTDESLRWITAPHFEHFSCVAALGTPISGTVYSPMVAVAYSGFGFAEHPLSMWSRRHLILACILVSFCINRVLNHWRHSGQNQFTVAEQFPDANVSRAGRFRVLVLRGIAQSLVLDSCAFASVAFVSTWLCAPRRYPIDISLASARWAFLGCQWLCICSD